MGQSKTPIGELIELVDRLTRDCSNLLQRTAVIEESLKELKGVYRYIRNVVILAILGALLALILKK